MPSIRSSIGPLSPGTMADDATVGTVAWTNPNNAKVSDNVYATADVTTGPACDNSIKLVKGGVISGTDLSAGAGYPTSDAYTSFGSSSNLWGLSLVPGDINASNFGVAVSAKKSDGSVITHYLKATNFGFTIPTGAIINGVVVEVERYNNALSSIGNIDHIRITVYYTIVNPPMIFVNQAIKRSNYY